MILLSNCVVDNITICHIGLFVICMKIKNYVNKKSFKRNIVYVLILFARGN